MTDVDARGWMSWLSGALVLSASALLGALVGGFGVTRLVGTAGMGWDQLADTLGGVLAGGTLGMAGGAVGVLKLDSKGRFWMTGAAAIGCVVAAVSLQVTQPRVRTGTVTPAPPPPVRSFVLQVGVADGLAGPPSEGNRLPWTFLRIASNLSLDYEPAGSPRRHCVATGIDSPAGISLLTALRETLANLPASADCEPCPSCMDVSLEWFLDESRRTASVTDRCWRSHPQLQSLRSSVEQLFAAYAPTAACSASAP